MKTGRSWQNVRKKSHLLSSSSHTGKTNKSHLASSSSQITQGRPNQTLLGWSSLKRSSVEVVNQVSNKRMKVNDTKIVTITLDESNTNDNIEIIEHMMNQRKTGSRRIYYDKPKTSTMVQSKYNEEASRLIALAHSRQK